jgi:hypothetical protein
VKKSELTTVALEATEAWTANQKSPQPGAPEIGPFLAARLAGPE